MPVPIQAFFARYFVRILCRHYCRSCSDIGNSQFLCGITNWSKMLRVETHGPLIRFVHEEFRLFVVICLQSSRVPLVLRFSRRCRVGSLVADVLMCPCSFLLPNRFSKVTIHQKLSRHKNSSSFGNFCRGRRDPLSFNACITSAIQPRGLTCKSKNGNCRAGRRLGSCVEWGGRRAGAIGKMQKRTPASGRRTAPLQAGPRCIAETRKRPFSLALFAGKRFRFAVGSSIIEARYTVPKFSSGLFDFFSTFALHNLGSLARYVYHFTAALRPQRYQF